MARPCPICDLKPQVLRFCSLKLDRRTKRFCVGGDERHLEPAAFDVLELLMADPGRVWSRDQIAQQIDPVGMRDITRNAMSQWIMGIRRAIGDAAAINTLYCHGYVLVRVSEAVPIIGHRRGRRMGDWQPGLTEGHADDCRCRQCYGRAYRRRPDVRANKAAYIRRPEVKERHNQLRRKTPLIPAISALAE